MGEDEDLGNKSLASELKKTNGRKTKKIANTFDTIEVAMFLLKLLSNEYVKNEEAKKGIYTEIPIRV